MKTVTFIFARGGSKGLPKKNLLQINGIPLIGHSINMAKKIVSENNIFLSTDCEEISKVGKDLGVQIIKRPQNLAEDNSSEWLAWQHAINWVLSKHGAFDIFLSLPSTAPLRIEKDVRESLKKFIQRKDADILLTISKSKKSPWFNMVKIYKDSTVSLINSSKDFNRRQDTPPTFDITTVAYVSTPDHILKNKSIWDGTVLAHEIPLKRAVDIDDILDFEFAKFLAERDSDI